MLNDLSSGQNDERLAVDERSVSCVVATSTDMIEQARAGQEEDEGGEREQRGNEQDEPTTTTRPSRPSFLLLSWRVR